MGTNQTFVNKQTSEKVTAEMAEEVTFIKTLWGEAQINPGVWIVTNSKGEQYGVPQADMDHFYVLLGDTPEEKNKDKEK